MTDDTSKESDDLQRFSEEFDTLCQLRHEVGREEYGPVAFLKAPLIRMAAEELADFSNYVRYMYVRLRRLEMILDARGIDLSSGAVEEIRGDDEIPPGPSSFVSAEEIQRFLPQKEPGG